ncbi:hypothetical protein Ancab_016703 [Ancistrocladus abbreviatus]
MPEVKTMRRRVQIPLNPRMIPLLLCSSIMTGSPNTLGRWVDHGTGIVSKKDNQTEVSRKLVGGVKVVGIYVWVGDSTFKNSTLTLCQAAKGVAGATPLSDTDWDERLLIHICCSPGRWTC